MHTTLFEYVSILRFNVWVDEHVLTVEYTFIYLNYLWYSIWVQSTHFGHRWFSIFYSEWVDIIYSAIVIVDAWNHHTCIRRDFISDRRDSL